MKKLLKNLLILGIICCLSVSGSVLAAPIDSGEQVSPYTMYYLSGSLGFSEGTNSVAVIVSTNAFTYIDKIYHDVEIYKNGSLYLSQRFSDTDCQSLDTQVTVPTVSGDIISVNVKHYTYHNGITESGTNSDAYLF